MKNLILILVILPILNFAQNSVEKSLFNIQTGFIGVWINNELKLTNDIVLRSELGLEPTWVLGEGTSWHANIRAEPRYYYNLDKRNSKGKRIAKNTANFWALAMNYRPKGKYSIESYSFVPKWGIRRVKNKFNYELGVGFGYRKEKEYGSFAEIDLHLRIGFTF